MKLIRVGAGVFFASWLGLGSAQAQSIAGPPLTGPTSPLAPIVIVVTNVTPPAASTPAPPRFRTFGSFATTPDQQAIAAQLDGRARQPGTDLAGVMDELTRLPASEVPAALEQLSPSSYDADTRAALAAGALHVGLIAGFLDETASAPQPDGQPWTPWVSGLSGTQDGRDGSSSRTLGGAGGADYRLGRNIRFGFAYGSEHTDVTHVNSATRGQIDTMNYSSYAVWKWSNGYVEGIVNLAEQNLDDVREIRFGSLNRLAASRHDGRGTSGYLGTGYDVTIAGLRLRPTAAVEYSRFTQQGFTEDGAGSLNLAVDGSSADALQSQLGVRLDYETHLAGLTITPRAAFAWGHHFVTDPRELQARFPGAGNETFTVHGADEMANGFEARGGAALEFFGVSAFVDYAVAFAGGAGVSHTLKAGVWSRF